MGRMRKLWGRPQDEHVRKILRDTSVEVLDVRRLVDELGFSEYTVAKHVKRIAKDVGMAVKGITNLQKYDRKCQIIRGSDYVSHSNSYFKNRKPYVEKVSSTGKDRYIADCSMKETGEVIKLVISARSEEEVVKKVYSTYHGVRRIAKIRKMEDYNKTREMYIKPKMTSGRLPLERKTQKYTL